MAEVKKVKLRVPATTANMGPGFDSLGCALSLYNYFTFEKTENGVEILGCDDEYCTKENLAYQGYEAAMKYMGLPVGGVKITVESNIPICRGLGSSAAMIVAGAEAANVLNGKKMSPEDILAVCNDIEGHPDNLAPAIYGGMTVSMMDGRTPHTVSYILSPELHFCALIPDFETSTNDARKVLPKRVDYADALFNITRAGILLKALENGDIDLVCLGVEDKLHQPYRKKLIHEYDDVHNICKQQEGVAFFISGSGSTCMCISKEKNFADKLDGKFDGLTKNWKALQLSPDREGVKILEVV
ncbi:MAG: homoserine kinase [Eubacteriales bacterium]|nr:homoserine kinase [Eubacteriales bacterium]MDD4390634.1 homoserine kinase [Eubacteriales bacterium]